MDNFQCVSFLLSKVSIFWGHPECHFEKLFTKTKIKVKTLTNGASYRDQIFIVPLSHALNLNIKVSNSRKQTMNHVHQVK